MTDGMTVAQYYATSLLNQWVAIGELSRQYRDRMLASDLNSPETREIIRRYISSMTDFWGELAVKVRGRNDESIPAGFAEEFMKYEQYFYSPITLPIDENAGDIFKLHMALREAVERLGITKFER